MLMFRLKCTIITVLVLQLTAGPWVLNAGLAQVGSGDGGATPGGKGRPAAGSRGGGAGGGGGGGKQGVVSVTPSEETVPGGQALSQAVAPDKYLMGAGDGLAVTLWGAFDDTYDVKVSPDGKVNLPGIGEVKVEGLTLLQTQELLETEVKQRHRGVMVGVSLTSLRVFQVLVLGEVMNPGTYFATPVKRVSDVIAQTGGVLGGGSQRRIQVRRKGQVVAIADLVAFLRQGSEQDNPFLHDGDVVFVPPMEANRVAAYITEVSTGVGGLLTESSVPYLVELKDGERLSVLLSAVGGPNPWWDLEGVLIQRETKAPEGTMRIPIDLRRYLNARDESQNVVLEAGDQVYIPAQVRRIHVAGAVKQAGTYSYFPGRHAEEYVMRAGGPSLTADFSRSFIQRADGTTEPYFANVELNNGDTVVVLEKFFKTWQDYFALVGTVTGVILSTVGFYAAFTNFGR